MKPQTTVQTEIKPLNYKQLAALYEISHRTLKSWLEPFSAEIGVMRGRTFTIRQVRMIIEKLGDPKERD